MSSPPPGYTGEESMLQGGTAPIVSVMGGGAKTTKGALKKIRKQLSKRDWKKLKRTRKYRKKQDGGALPVVLSNPDFSISELNGAPYNMNVVTEALPPASSISITNLPEVPAPEQYFFLANTYTKYSKLQWVRSDGSGAINAKLSTTGVIPTRGNSSFTSAGSDRLGIILPSSITKICVFPPIQGQMLIFKKCLALSGIFDEQGIVTGKDPVAILFTPPFFGDPATTNSTASTNAELFAYYMTLKNMIIVDAAHSMCILTPFSSANISISRNANMIINIGNDSTPIYPLLEPTYVVFPYPVNISNSDLDPESKGGIFFSAAATGEEVLPAPAPSMSGLIDTVTKTSIRPTADGGFETFAPLSSVAYKPVVTKLDPGLTKMNYVIVDTRTDIDMSTYYVYSSKKNPDYKAPAVADSNGLAFFGQVNAFTKDIARIPVSLGLDNFLIRASVPSVIEDWNKGVFDDEEARFLNALNLTPQHLYSVFKGNWTKELAENLTIMSRSKCFTDNRLILHADCQRTQRFIARMFSHYIDNAKEIAAMRQNELNASMSQLTNIIRAQAAALKAANGIPGRGQSYNVFDVNDFANAIFNSKNPPFSATPDPKTQVLSVLNFTVASMVTTTSCVVSFDGALTQKDNAILSAMTGTCKNTSGSTYTITFTTAFATTAAGTAAVTSLANTNTYGIKIKKDVNAKLSPDNAPFYNKLDEEYGYNIMVYDLNDADPDPTPCTLTIPAGPVSEISTRKEQLIDIFQMMKYGKAGSSELPFLSFRFGP